MLDTLSWVGLVVILLGLVIASEPLPFPKALPTGLFIASIGLIAANLKSLLTGTVFFTSSFSSERQIFRTSSSSFRGVTARIWGAEMIFIGIGIAFIALKEWFSSGWALAWVKSPLGMAQLLLVGGLVVANTGLVAMLGTAESRESRTAFLLSLPSRLFGLVVLFAGLVLFGLGLIQLTAPGAIGRWIRESLPLIPTPPAIPGSIFFITLWR